MCAFCLLDPLRPLVRLDLMDVEVVQAGGSSTAIEHWGGIGPRPPAGGGRGGWDQMLDGLSEGGSTDSDSDDSDESDSDASCEGEAAASVEDDGSYSSSSDDGGEGELTGEGGGAPDDDTSSPSSPSPPPPAAAVVAADAVDEPLVPEGAGELADVDEPAAALAPVPRPGRKGKATLEINVHGGTLKYYSNKRAIIAHCDRHGHHDCRLTRTLCAAKAAGRPGQGRPIGLLCAWLAAADHEDFDSPQLHVRMKPLPEYEDRVLARAEFSTLSDAPGWLALERPLAAEEDDEPAFVP